MFVLLNPRQARKETMRSLAPLILAKTVVGLVFAVESRLLFTFALLVAGEWCIVRIIRLIWWGGVNTQ
jgi:hypothetical protein